MPGKSYKVLDRAMGIDPTPIASDETLRSEGRMSKASFGSLETPPAGMTRPEILLPVTFTTGSVPAPKEITANIPQRPAVRMNL